MGYCIELVESDFVIKKSNFEQALAALKSVFIVENMTCFDNPYGPISDNSCEIIRAHFSWVETEDVMNCKTLIEALREIRYEPVLDNNGDIISVRFIGQKYGDEKIFFNAIAKYVEPNSYIKFQGEDDCEWLWLFDGETAKRFDVQSFIDSSNFDNSGSPRMGNQVNCLKTIIDKLAAQLSPNEENDA